MPTALDAYFDEIRGHQILTRTEEEKLARRYRRTRAPELLDQLVTANLRLVVKIAREYRWSGQELSDLVAEGNHGLVIATARFEPRHHVRLSTYAAFWIRARIMRFIIRNWRLVRVGTTGRQRRIMAGLRQVERHLESLGGEATTAGVAASLGMDEREVAALRRHITAPELPIDAPVRGDSGLRLADVLAGGEQPDDTAERHELDGLVREVVSEFERSLDARDRHILRARWLRDEPVTLTEIGERFGVSRERVRQLERRVLDRLRAAMDERLAA